MPRSVWVFILLAACASPGPQVSQPATQSAALPECAPGVVAYFTEERPPSPADLVRMAGIEGATLVAVDVRPDLLNIEEVQRALMRAYPPALRDAGISGET